MRLNNDVQFRRDTNFAAQTVRMTVDENNIQHIMSVLTDLYSDPMMAVIREYSTNAHDSHLAAGNPDPIEVSLPGAFERTFRVTDKGVGLSVDDLVNIYSKYGYSTKRDNDNESGMLGLGCKAGLTYTDQFSLTAVKDGIKTIAIVARGEDGAGVIDIVDTVGTDEPNGVVIAVPVKDTTTFNQRAQEFFRFWEPGTVLVDGKEPEPIKGLDVTDDITVVTDNNLSSDFVVMGNIGYTAGTRLSGRLPYGYKVVAKVKMGDVNFTPNREALYYTPRTEAALRDIAAKMQSGLVSAAQREIDKCATHYDAMMDAQHWRRLVRVGSLTYKGVEIPTSFTGEGWNYNLSAHRYAMSSFKNYIDISTMNKSLQVTGYENETVSTTVRKKVRQYISDNDLQVSRVLFVKERMGGRWTKGLPVVDYSVIKAIKLNRNKKANGRPAGEPISFYKNGTQDRADINLIPGNKKVVYSSAQELSGRVMSETMPDYTFVMLNKNRWDKYMRENSGTITVDEAFKNALEEVRNQLTPRETLELSGNTHVVQNLRNLDPQRILDPELRELVRDLDKELDKDRLRRYRQIQRFLNNLDIRIDNPDGELGILDKYPLLEYTGSADIDHQHDYVNYFYEKENA